MTHTLRRYRYAWSGPKPTLDHHPIPVSFIAKVCHPIPARSSFLWRAKKLPAFFTQKSKVAKLTVIPELKNEWKSLTKIPWFHRRVTPQISPNFATALGIDIFLRSSGGAQPPGFHRQTCFHWKPPLGVLGPWSLDTPKNWSEKNA